MVKAFRTANSCDLVLLEHRESVNKMLHSLCFLVCFYFLSDCDLI